MEYTEGTIIEPTSLGDGTSLAIRAHQVTAITPESYADTIGLGRAIRSLIDGITTEDAPEIAKAFQLHKSLIKKRDEKLAPLEIAYAYLKEMIAAYDQEQERLRRQKELEAQEALRKQQEEAAIAEAQALQASGDTEGAMAVISQAAASPAPAVVIPSAVPKVAGKVSRTIWRWRVKDISKIKPEYLLPAQPNELAIIGIVRALHKNAESAVGGIEVYSEVSVSLR